MGKRTGNCSQILAGIVGILLLWCLPIIIHAATPPNTITFDNQSGEPALVKLMGDSSQAVAVVNGQKATVHAAAGDYYILVQYGNEAEEYRFTKGDPFTVTQTGTQYSIIRITLHPVVAGNYETEPISRTEFERAQIGEGKGVEEERLRGKAQRTRRELASAATVPVPKKAEHPDGLSTAITAKDGAPMVLIPAGQFKMGSNRSDRQKPPHKVQLNAFYIDKFEVTTVRYAEFMKATERAHPNYWKLVNLGIHGNRPVVGVTWHDAKAYCEHWDKRLPTEAEWEKAARGTDERKFPWGNKRPTLYSELGNFGRGDPSSFLKSVPFNYEMLTNVGNFFQGYSPYGVSDMAGNVWEWVNDWYDESYYHNSPIENPQGPQMGLHTGLTPVATRSCGSSEFFGAEPGRLR